MWIGSPLFTRRAAPPGQRPARPSAAAWPATAQDRNAVWERLAGPPFAPTTAKGRTGHHLGLRLLRASTDPDGRPKYDAKTGLARVGLRLSSDRAHVRIEVWDQDSRPPIAKTAGPGDESGRGPHAGRGTLRTLGM